MFERPYIENRFDVWGLGGHKEGLWKFVITKKNYLVSRNGGQKTISFFHVPRLAYRSQLTAFNFFYDDNLQQLKIADQISRKTPYGPSKNSESVRQYARIG